jgi:succinylglutamate desuccinylase
MYHLYYAQSAKCVLARKFRDFEPVAKGTLLAYDYDGAAEICAPRDSVILFANKDVKKAGDEVFLLGEYVD